MKILNISIRVKDTSFYSETEELRKMGHDIDLTECTSDELDADDDLFKSLIGTISKTDFVIIRVSGDVSIFKKNQIFLEEIQNAETSLLIVNNILEKSFQYRNLFLQGDDDYTLLTRYAALGGSSNNKGILIWALNTFENKNLDLPEPIIPPAQGVYYPGRKSTDILEYIHELDKTKPVIGLLLSQRKWNSGKLDHIDRLIHAIEDKGASALPIFLNYAENKDTGCIGIKGIIDNCLLCDEKSVVDFVINTIPSSITIEAKLRSEDPNDKFLERLGVPVMQSPVIVYDEERWKSDIYGLTNAEIAYDVAFPEFDGQIISIPNASSETDENNVQYYSSIESRVDDVADMAVMWARLRKIPNNEKKVAIILYMYPPASSHAGGAADLDTFQSVRNMLIRLKNEGYSLDWIPESSEELVEKIFAGITNDTEWVSDQDISSRAAAMISKHEYETWFNELSEDQKNFLIKDWGKPPGSVLVINKSIAVPGIINGNVIISFQPSRGKDLQSAYHNHNCSMPHQYVSFYKWLRHSFGANAVIHVGTHGTLEWLPGKGVALSKDCCPDYVLSGLPNLYPYVIGNPGEGTQAKRRSYAVLVDHMIPAMVRAGSYDDISELESVLQTYMKTESMKQMDQLDIVKKDLYDIVKRLSMFSDIGLEENASPEQVGEMADELYDYVLNFKENIIKDGLHVFGTAPSGERLYEMIYSLVRLRNGNVPSLLESIAHARGLNFRELKADCSAYDEASGLFNGDLVDEIEEEAMNLIRLLSSAEFNAEECRNIATSRYPQDNSDLLAAIDFICQELRPNIEKITEEMDSLMIGLNGEYVLPGPSGCPTRGRAQILPTGRNFFTVDPEAVPTPASWELGKRMAEQMIERYLKDKGAYPESIAIVIWSTDTMKTGGDDVAYILHLMGVKPVWAGYGNQVIGLEVVPLSELGRPRIDVTINMSGLFRDTFPNLTDLINKAVQIVSELDEADETNYLKMHFRKELMDNISAGMPEDEARKRSMLRIFSSSPGQYGTGVNVLISTSNWKDRSDLGAYYREVGCYAYGMGINGVPDPETYKKKLSRVKVTVKNSTSREYDLFDNDDVFQYLGGLNSAVESVTGSMPMSLIGCSADTDDPVLRTIQEESRYVFRSKVLNPKYEKGLREHGFRGASEILKMFEYVFGWDATSDIIENWMYDGLAENYLLDDEVRGWIEESNPYAVRDMIGVLLEAADRDMWKPSEATAEKLKDLYLKNEAVLEKITDV
ncbi:hypothetical protein A3207_08350 [Candidatus Methanomassiliicoccus intestinalis]|uniref:CobN/magnesium chelatase domain-containing protein n=1 Tax=Candidatus Methanomassiliicoccus intestinalis TaxID=1406512 RepID=A0A8J8PCL7_9ARCH|nr:MAG: hypothetical protein A3207_08350 [Candidatus Methanomassiliicoccus intestinalis]